MVTKEIEKEQTINEIVQAKSRNLAICILFYEKLKQTIECIRSFLPSGVNIYILNNGSSPSTRQALGQFCDNYKQIKIFDSGINLGVGVGRNYLITHTFEEWLLFVDNDITMKTSDWVQKFAKYVYQHDDTEVFIPNLFNVHENNYVSYRSMRIVGDKVIHDKKIVKDLTNTFPGGASFIKRKLFDRLGLYDDKMFIGFEDFELCIRAIRLANPVKAQLINDIELIHKHHKLDKDEDKNAVLMRYNLNFLEASFNRITEKHNVILESNWKSWVASQLKVILKKHRYVFNNNWKQWIYKKVRKIIK